MVASILASTSSEHILDGEQASLQDTNDHFLANLQRNGTYSVVPRVPGGDITPEQLILIGEIARDFGLYTKITGGQRIDMFGATVDQLPQIWARLVEGGMESGPPPTARRYAPSRWAWAPTGAATASRIPFRWPSIWSCAIAVCGRRTRSRWAYRAARAGARRPEGRTSA